MTAPTVGSLNPTSRAAVATMISAFRSTPLSCDEVLPIRTAVEQWFRKEGAELIFRRGMHKGRPLAEVAVEKTDYLEWMLGADDMEEEVLDVVRGALAAGTRRVD